MEDRQSKNDKISWEVWKVIETKAKEVGIIKAKGRGEEKGEKKRIRRERTKKGKKKKSKSKKRKIIEVKRVVKE